jgi:hypothetical protein
MEEIIIHPTTGERAVKIDNDGYIPMSTHSEMEALGWFDVIEPPVIPPQNGDLYTLMNSDYGYFSDMLNTDIQKIEYPHSESINFDHGSTFAIEFDFTRHLTNNNYERLVSKIDSSNSDYRGLHIDYTTNEINIGLRHSASNKLREDFYVELEPYKRYRIKIAYDGVFSVYVDGVITNKTLHNDTLNGLSCTNTTPLVLMGDDYGNSVAGIMNHFAVYSTANTSVNLSASVLQIADMPDQVELALFSDFEDDVFPTVNEEVNNNHGTCINMVEDNRMAPDHCLTKLHMQNESDIEPKRQELVDFIFNGNGIPTESALIIEEDFQNDAYIAPDRTAYTNLDHIKKLTCENGIHDTNAYHFVPVNPNGRAIIFAFGHGDLWTDVETFNYDNNIIQAIDSGYQVVCSYMLERGDNGNKGHNYFLDKDTESFVSVEYFMRPYAMQENYLSGYEIHMYGHSGGAWATSLYSAMSTTITTSCEVAGTLADFIHHMNREPSPSGDYEQAYNPESTSSQMFDFVSGVCGRLDQYVLAGYNRKHTQILIKSDTVGSGIIGVQSEQGVLWADYISQIPNVNYEFLSDETTGGAHISSNLAFNEFLTRI